MKTSIDSRNAEIDTLTTLLDGGFLKMFTGSQPASPESEETGELLATLKFNAPSYASAINGRAKANPLGPDLDASGTGNAGWFRCYKSDGQTALLDGSVGVKNSGADIEMNSVSIQIHTEVSLEGLDITLP